MDDVTIKHDKKDDIELCTGCLWSKLFILYQT